MTIKWIAWSWVFTACVTYFVEVRRAFKENENITTVDVMVGTSVAVVWTLSALYYLWKAAPLF